jgi:hypothetical protein
MGQMDVGRGKWRYERQEWRERLTNFFQCYVGVFFVVFVVCKTFDIAERPYFCIFTLVLSVWTKICLQLLAYLLF